MGQNLILNMDSKGFVVCAYNRTVDKVFSNWRMFKGYLIKLVMFLIITGRTFSKE